MKVHHHLDEATLLRYASGDFDEAFSVIVASHLAMCDACRRAVRLAEAVGGNLLEAEGETALSEGAFDRLMQRVEKSNAHQATVKTQAPISSDRKHDVPAPLRRFIGDNVDEISWKTIAPGVRKHAIRLKSPTSSLLYMLHIAPGKAVPEHGHGGAEMTLVLAGAYRDELGRFARGDIADLDEHVEHQPRVEPGEACICLVATEQPTRFKGLLSRLLQPLVGI